MERIPYILREKMTMDCVYLEKKRRGWDEIHKDLKTPYLYLRKTPYVFHDEFKNIWYAHGSAFVGDLKAFLYT